MNLQMIQHLYPKTANNNAITGCIPMDWFMKYEHIVRYTMKKHGLRLYYRGPRDGNSLTTKRANATGVVLYKQPIKQTPDKQSNRGLIYMIFTMISMELITMEYALGILSKILHR